MENTTTEGEITPDQHIKTLETLNKIYENIRSIDRNLQQLEKSMEKKLGQVVQPI